MPCRGFYSPGPAVFPLAVAGFLWGFQMQSDFSGFPQCCQEQQAAHQVHYFLCQAGQESVLILILPPPLIPPQSGAGIGISSN